jgi:hypothetical protein
VLAAQVALVVATVVVPVVVRALRVRATVPVAPPTARCAAPAMPGRRASRLIAAARAARRRPPAVVAVAVAPGPVAVAVAAVAAVADRCRRTA